MADRPLPHGWNVPVTQRGPARRQNAEHAPCHDWTPPAPGVRCALNAPRAEQSSGRFNGAAGCSD